MSSRGGLMFGLHKGASRSASGSAALTASGRGRSIVALTIASLLASMFVVVPLQRVAAVGNTAVQLDLPVASSPGAVQLNGTSQYITLGTATQLRSPTFTVELWFQRTGAGASASTGSGGVTSHPPDHEGTGGRRDGGPGRELLPRHRRDERQAGGRLRGGPGRPGGHDPEPEPSDHRQHRDRHRHNLASRSGDV